jgi:hypothetical protein
MHLLGWPVGDISRFAAPVIEEAIKGIIVVWLIRTERAGFLVDAAILGFAAGAGFALVENAYYLQSLSSRSLLVWVIRGCGTALVHGGTTSILAIAAKSLLDRRPGLGLLAFLPGWALAVLLHALFNLFVVSPVMSMLVVLVVLPLLFVAVFERSERALQRWMGVGFDADAALLEIIRSGGFGGTRQGAYLESLRERFPGEAIADMLCYVRLDAELSLRAKGELMMREAGMTSRIEPDIQAKLDEMAFLQRSIGPTGRLALLPLLRPGGRALWQRQLLRTG